MQGRIRRFIPGNTREAEGCAVFSGDDREVQVERRQRTGADGMAQHSCMEGACGHRREVRQEGVPDFHRGQDKNEVVGGEWSEGIQDRGSHGEGAVVRQQTGDGARRAPERAADGREPAADAASAATGSGGQPVLSATAAGHAVSTRDELWTADGRLPFLA